MSAIAAAVGMLPRPNLLLLCIGSLGESGSDSDLVIDLHKARL